MNLKARLKALERPRQASQRNFRLVAPDVCGPLNLADSTCVRRMAANGFLTEVVDLHGGNDGLTDEELKNFIANFPVTMMREM